MILILSLPDGVRALRQSKVNPIVLPFFFALSENLLDTMNIHYKKVSNQIPAVQEV